MQPKSIPSNPKFVGRQYERSRLEQIASRDKASILVVHGRRRVGKTELIEQAFRDRNIIKFEGIEKKGPAYQRRRVLRQLAEYTGDLQIASLKLTTWLEVFEYIARYVATGTWTLFFEEVQWLSCYRTDFVSELKYVWDNKLRYNKDLLLVLCGSSPSFMIGKVMESKALHNRSMHELPLAPFSLAETRTFLGERRGRQEIMDAYLSVGGIPEYLEYLKEDSSVFLSLCRNSFAAGGFFSVERDRVFVSSLSSNPHYAAIVDFLSVRHYATRAEIATHLKMESGGSLSRLLKDLELCGFIERITRYDERKESRLARYAIRDNYLQFYYKFIHERRAEIARGEFNRDPTAALPANTYYAWLGYAFERYCRDNARKIAGLLGFGAVSYKAGFYYDRSTEVGTSGCQIDLVFERADRVFTLCEIKYLREPATREVYSEFHRKLAAFPNPKNLSIHTVLIAANGAEPALRDGGYFDRILTLEDIFAAETG